MWFYGSKRRKIGSTQPKPWRLYLDAGGKFELWAAWNSIIRAG